MISLTWILTILLRVVSWWNWVICFKNLFSWIDMVVYEFLNLLFIFDSTSLVTSIFCSWSFFEISWTSWRTVVDHERPWLRPSRSHIFRLVISRFGLVGIWLLLLGVSFLEILFVVLVEGEHWFTSRRLEHRLFGQLKQSWPFFALAFQSLLYAILNLVKHWSLRNITFK